MTISKRLLALTLIAAFAVSTASVHAQDSVRVNAEGETRVEKTGVRGFLNGVLNVRGEQKVRVGTSSVRALNEDGERAGTPSLGSRLDAKINHLLALKTRIESSGRFEGGQQARMIASIEAQIAALEALQERFEGQDVRGEARAEFNAAANEIRATFHAMPKAAVSAAADRALAIASRMEGFADRLMIRIEAAQDEGQDMTAALEAHASLLAHVEAAETAANAALSLVADLSVEASTDAAIAENRRILSAARDKIEEAHTELRAAREDIASILAGLGIEVKASVRAEVQ